jgi:type VII secretion protein EccB
MATKRDQLQSHQFLVQRMVSALVTRQSDPEQPPFRRPSGAAFGSIVIAVLVLAGFGVYGLVKPGGSKAWSKGDVVVVEKETGTRYVYIDGRLHPVTNYVSALLAVGKKAETTSISRKSLLGVPRGPQIGIRDAPDALPGPDRLLDGGWTYCSQPSLDVTGARTSDSVLLVGQRPPAGTQMIDAAMLVEVIGTKDQYLISSRGYRHRIQPSDTVTVGLALGSEPWARVGSAFVDALPAGQALAPIRLSNLGKPSKALPDRPGTLIGQLFVVNASGGGVQHYLADRDQLLPISSLQFDIQRAYRPVAAAYHGKAPYGIQLGLLSAGRAKQAEVNEQPGQAPRSRPDFVATRDGAGTVCATFQPGASTPEIFIEPAMPPRDASTMTAQRSTAGTALADRILVPPGYAAVVETMPTQQAPAGTLAVVTDLGRSYPLADPKLLEVLGYAGIQPIRMPAGLVARIPQGSGLNPSAAMRQTSN